ncbi:hypothetical protein K493DRAFT_314301 [Basidiobolus meristosporus CBS 931.73]|uniref:DUF7137 domain-containing protein n=1 Tax=Basidiobolus meristosporus CBS 931.73 TaxID=1314790 RepID=A0A1Y1WDX7_9FUNG|nr:hypothetical protein K493DRAFT_321773 [Basidiobolus meristosporus CBS 931.73]ORX96863.1 hypothetical protein K493DRAFT_314301 [Basidiobolus meristosporus CBS 931.73]|eukprot:ORX71723.1 hypothetical protein K493DRAFT_321773 [Basidiobolus meristosporus CBS 931.73]
MWGQVGASSSTSATTSATTSNPPPTSSNTGSPSPTPSSTSSISSNNTSSSDSPSSTSSGLGSVETGSGNNDTSDSTNGYPGRLTMIEPHVVWQQLVLLPIGRNITFKWDYNNDLKVQPKKLSITLQLPGSRNQYPLALNISGDTKEWVWDTNEWSQSNPPLVQGIGYELHIFDQRGETAHYEPGHLLPYTLPFHMYKFNSQPIPPSELSSAISLSGSISTLVLCMLMLFLL